MSLKGSVPKTIVEPSQASTSKKKDITNTGTKAKRPKTSGGSSSSVKRTTTSEMKNELVPKTKQSSLSTRYYIFEFPHTFFLLPVVTYFTIIIDLVMWPYKLKFFAQIVNLFCFL